jgi:hypothetical protein
MISSNIADQIKLYISVNDFLTDKRLPTDTELDEYIIKNYTDECKIEVVRDDFITYKVFDDHIFIKDFVSFGNGIGLLNNVLKQSKELSIPIRAMVHFSNTQVLNICFKRYKFEIIGATDNQFILERK